MRPCAGSWAEWEAGRASPAAYLPPFPPPALRRGRGGSEAVELAVEVAVEGVGGGWGMGGEMVSGRIPRAPARAAPYVT